MSGRKDLLAERRAELERRLAALSPEKRAQVGQPPADGAASAAARGVTPRAPGTPVPMSFAQELLWLLERASPGHGYNVPRTARALGPLNVDALSRALDALVARHEVLRSTFDMVDGEMRQLVDDAGHVELSTIDLRDRPVSSREEDARSLVRDLTRRPFDLTVDSQLRVTLVRLADEDHVLLLESHHVASDAWSRNILMRELSTLYDAFIAGREPQLAPPAVQYGDFAIWQRGALQGERLESLLAYWREQLHDAPSLLELPTDRPRPVTPSFDGNIRSRMLPASLLERLRALSRANDATLFMTLLAAFDVLLARLSGQDDIVIGSPIAGRTHEGTESLVGYFANTLVLRALLGDDPTFVDLLARVRETSLAAYEHQDVPYEKLVLELQRGRSLGRGQLFQVMFTLQDAELRGIQLAGLRMESFGGARGATKFDLSLFMQEQKDGLRAAFEYRTDLYDAETIDRLLAVLEVLLESVVAEPSVRVSSLRLLPDAERVILDAWSAGPPQSHDAATLHELIAQQAARTPNAIAVEAEGDDPHGPLCRITFRELHERAAVVARYLAAQGVGPDVGVGICIERSPELVVAMLGVLQAGGYYLPLDPEYPADRLAFMLDDARVPVLLTVDRLRNAVPTTEHTPVVVALDRDWETIAANPGATPRPAFGADLAYVIYTSGSTGKPKGVMIQHRAVVNYLSWMRGAFPLGTADAVLQKAPASFDACIWEFFLPLASGARLVLARVGGHQDPAYLLSALEKHDVTLLQLVPSQLQMMLETPGADAPTGLPRLRRLFLGGEALPSELLSRLASVCPALRVTNLYGPTEATVYATHWSVDLAEWRGGTVPIGQPVAGAFVHVVDAHRRPTPIGVPGELCIGGVQVARGYLNRPELTAEKFVPDVFAAGRDAARTEARLYRTGDRARYRSDGTLEYLGRIDTQVKLRGFRVELGEIENALVQLGGVQSAVVLVREDTPGDQRLVAYCIAEPGGSDDSHAPAAMRQQLKTTLPEFMVPSAFVWLQEWPMNANGKLDRKALPVPEAADAPVVKRVAPRTQTEAKLVAIWSDVLQQELGVHDDFFELGGHSLLALRVLNRVWEQFQVRIPLRAMFEAPTVEQLAARVDGGAGQQPEGPALLRRPGNQAPLTYLQELLWLVQRTTPELGVYNVVDQWAVTGDLDVGALQGALDLLVERHEMLRTTIAASDTGPVQTIGAPRPVPLETIDLSALLRGERDAELARVVRERSATPFDLSRDLLLRATLVRLAEREHVFVLASHHVAYDGWSRSVLLRDLSTAYAALHEGRVPALPASSVRFADFAAWQRERLDDASLQKSLRDWAEHFASSPLDVELPTDRPRRTIQTFAGGKRTVVLPLALLQRLNAIARESDATLFTVLFTAFQTLLHRYSHQDDVIVGTIVAGRNQPGLEHVVGNFVNTVPLRASFAGDPTFRQLVTRAKEEYFQATERADVPFELLAGELQRERGAEASSFGQVHFVLQNNAPSGLHLVGAEISSGTIEATTTKFDLSLSMGEQSTGLRAVLQYRADLFDASTIDRMLGHLGTLLDGIARQPDARVSVLPLLTSREREQLLVEWNDTNVPYQHDAPVHQLVSANAAARPDALAVSAAEQSITYHELDARSNQLARHLVKLGATPGRIVGVCLPPSIDLVVSLLAILKTGAAYLALDRTYPTDRLAFMVGDAAVAALVLASTHDDPIPDVNVRRVRLIEDAIVIGEEPDGVLPPNVGGGDLANAVYTSGSTGTPKGTLLPHRGIVRLVTHTSLTQLGPDDVMAQVASPAFDAMTWEIWGALLNGARLHMVPRDVALDPVALREEIRRAGVTTLFLTTAVFNQMGRFAPDALRGVRYAIFGGEAADLESVLRVRDHSAPRHLINAYGPTEGTVFTLVHEVSDLPATATTVPVGRPISNTRVHILDAQRQLVPVGVLGELYIGGDGVALGYLNRPELTDERFIPDEFAPGDTLYRTGDIVRRRADGVIEFVGRADNQVKLRGVRIELGEIEAVMTADPDVGEAIAILREMSPGDSCIVAYIVPAPGAEPDLARLRSALQRALPQQMVPSAIVRLDAFPLTRNGKVDRKALPTPVILDEVETRSYRPPRTTIEHELVQIWERLFPGLRLGIGDDFFGLGGHSLLAMQMLTEVERIRGLRVPLAWLFESSTIESLAMRLGAEVRATTEPPLVVLQENGQGTPLAFLHGDVRGGGWYCRRLAPLASPESPFYVLPTIGVDGAMHPWTVETMASRHVAELRKVQPAGPYRLGGFCVGGIIAFEMARQLTAGGERVDRLVIVDSMAMNARLRPLRPLLFLMPGANRSARLTRQAAVMRRFRWYDRRLRQVSRLSAGEKFEWAVTNVARRVRRITGAGAGGHGNGTADTGAAHERSPSALRTEMAGGPGANVLVMQERAASAYIPGPYPGVIDLIWADERPGVPLADPTRGWGRVAEQVRVHPLCSSHIGLITNDLPLLAEALRTVLDRDEV